MSAARAVFQNRRQFARYRCSAPARVHTDATDFSCQVMDISGSGAKVAVSPALINSIQGDRWHLSVPKLGSLSARLVWRRGTEFGLMFKASDRDQVRLAATLQSMSKTDPAIRLITD